MISTSRPLRVLHVAACLAPRLGGPSTVAPEMCQALARAGVRVTLITTNLDEWAPMSRIAPPRVLNVPTDRPLWLNGVEVRYFPARWPWRLFFSPAMARELRRRVSEFDIVHVHSLYLFPTVAAAHYARRFRVPYLIRPHGTLDPYLRRRHRLRKFLYSLLIERRNLDRASAIHYTAQEELELARPLGIRAPGVVVPLGVNGKAFEHLPARGQFRRDYPSLNGKLLVVFLGRLTPKKGLDLLIDAFPLVLRQFRDAHLVIAGPDDEGFGPRVRQWIRKAGVENATTLVGMVEGDRKLALLADTDVWVLPSYTENFGIAAVEAMACGLPIVLSDKVNIHREVSEAQAGLITGCDPVQIAAAISQLLGDQSLRRCLGAAARELVAAKFTWDSAATSLVELYRELVRGAVPGRVPQVETADVR